MTIVRCPRCRDEVTIPPQAPLSALVRCPLCHEKYLLSEAAAQLPPALILVVSELEPQPYAHEPASEQPAPDEYQLATGIETGAPETRPAFRPSVRSAPRPNRKEKNALVELVKIVGGGVAGLALGLLFLWWVPRRDPLELGPTVSSYIPWLVPLEFHGHTKIGQGKTSTPPSGQVTITAGPKRDDKKPPASKEQPLPVPHPLPAKEAPQAAPEHAANNPKAAPSAAAAPMPDLRDLLPDGATPAPSSNPR